VRAAHVALPCLLVGLSACDAPSTPRSPAGPPVAARTPPAHALALDVAYGPVDPAAPVPARREGAYANEDPNDDLIVGPPDALADCDEQLARAGVRYKPSTLPVHTEHPSRMVCGAPQVVTYLRGPGDIAYNPTPLLTCPMALALASFEHIVQEEAERDFHSRVARIDQLGTYSCREIAAYPGWVSEHSYANAIDVAHYILKNGTTIEVMRDFDKGDGPPARVAGAFLRSVSRRAFDEEVFSHVLTPFFNAAHRDHFHLDLARYRGDGTRPWPEAP
jgi:hypothetical protein